jgi:hypothetical protein
MGMQVVREVTPPFERKALQLGISTRIADEPIEYWEGMHDDDQDADEEGLRGSFGTLLVTSERFKASKGLCSFQPRHSWSDSKIYQ